MILAPPPFSQRQRDAAHAQRPAMYSAPPIVSSIPFALQPLWLCTRCSPALHPCEGRVTPKVQRQASRCCVQARIWEQGNSQRRVPPLMRLLDHRPPCHAAHDAAGWTCPHTAGSPAAGRCPATAAILSPAAATSPGCCSGCAQRTPAAATAPGCCFGCAQCAPAAATAPGCCSGCAQCAPAAIAVTGCCLGCAQCSLAAATGCPSSGAALARCCRCRARAACRLFGSALPSSSSWVLRKYRSSPS